ncbi:MAG: hypothetical protein WD737_14300 [Gemmatimonadota bacterium]
MRLALACIAAVATLAGCASLPSAGSGPSRPLQAYLVPEAGSRAGLQFHVDRAAHVAIFRIVPGRGTSLVYPSPGYGSMDGRVFAGFRRVALDRSFNRDQFTPMLASAGYGPEYYFMIASERPLSAERFGAYGSGLRSAMGIHFATGSAYNAMERLVSLVVPDPMADGWATDFYVHWPETVRSRRTQQTVRIDCGGQTFFVPAYAAAMAYRQLCPTGEAPEDEMPSDSSSTVEAARRAPVAAANDRIGSTQLSNPAEWDRVRRAAQGDDMVSGRRGAIEDPAASSRRRDPGSSGIGRRPARGVEGSGAAPSRDRGSSGSDSERGAGARPASRPAAPPSEASGRSGGGSDSRAGTGERRPAPE